MQGKTVILNNLLTDYLNKTDVLKFSITVEKAGNLLL